MSEDKLSSDEVPQKFAEWLLSMGCPPEKVPSIDKVAGMCRGQYYMVWRSLMEHVEAKDSIRHKRLAVFCDDVRKCQKKNIFNKSETNAIVPEELFLWRQHDELKEKITDAEGQIMEAQGNLHHLMDKISSKLSQRNLSRYNLRDGQRRAWLLQQVAEELRAKRTNLQETRSIADSLCCIEENVDIESKLNKCLSTVLRQGSRPAAGASVSLLSAANPAACSSMASTTSDHNDSEDHLTSLVKCRGDVLFPQLYERRAGLCAARADTHADHTRACDDRVTPRSVLSHTAALHCTLALEAMKNRVHIKQTGKRLAAAITELNDYLTGAACELLVLRCERVRAEARVNALRAALDEMTSRGGVFAAAGGAADDARGAARQIATVDKAIESKRDELKKLIASAASTERKTHNVKECLIALFNSFHNDGIHDNDRFGGQLLLPQESISTLRQFYEERREKRRNKIELSLDLDVSQNCSFTDPTDNGSPKFVDELRIYLRKFNLEKNRKLVLESGEKIWIFETLQSSLERIHKKWQSDDVVCSLVCPSVSLSSNLQRLIQDVQNRDKLHEMLQNLDVCGRKIDAIEITSRTEEEQKIIDKIKKRLNENLLNLQKTNKTLDVGRENLQLWSGNEMRKYISVNRTVDGKTYKEYENSYLESLRL